jgi:hypothetical protein
VLDVVAFLALLMVVGVVFTAMAPEARERLGRRVLASLTKLKQAATRSRPGFSIVHCPLSIVLFPC